VHTVHIREEVVRNEDSEGIVQVCAERTKFAWVAGKTKRQVNALELDLSFVGGTIPRMSCMSQKPGLLPLSLRPHLASLIMEGRSALETYTKTSPPAKGLG
jgi:hypothetical protein